MPAGAKPKREREFKELESRFKQEHRYPGREEEVAARIVNKQRAQYGETQGERRKDRQGGSPDRDLPIEHYQHLTVGQIKPQLDGLNGEKLRQLRAYEDGHKRRKGVLDLLDSRLH
ncbi:MAG TPA: hypothetical protein DCW29_15330 [Janthinobacterium sp.]|nr:hypothetical protein [Janthinobacterium sp.]